MTTKAIMTALETFLLTTQNALSVNYFTNTADVKAVAIGSYQMLDKGVSFAAVLLPGKFDNESSSYNSLHRDDVLIDLFVRYESDIVTNWDTFTLFRDAIRDKLEGYPSLNGLDGVQQVLISTDEDPYPVVKGKNPEIAPVFIGQRLRVTVSQRVALSTGEYA